ncbi:ATP-binding protein [Streptomyces antimycoticus]|uniref:ATP-binding protein n=1 Tax=Streptomyces antimycoticus TaxID=68175 RepID=UPI003444D456
MTITHSPGALVGPPWRIVLASVEGSAKAARNFTGEYVKFYVPDIGDGPLDDVLLVASELVTNSIRYGSEPGDSLCVALAHGPDNVTIEVHDTRRRRPHLKPESVERNRGRGLFIVDALATWGVRDRPFGKIVWAVVKW